MTDMTQDGFNDLLASTLRARTADTAPAHLEQRLLAHLHNTHSHLAPDASRLDRPPLFSTHDRVQVRRSPFSSFFAFAAHVVALVLIFAVAHRALSTHATLVTRVDTMELAPPPPPIASHADAAHGGGGQAGPTPVTQGRLPQVAPEQLLPPKVAVEEPKLAVDPSIVIQSDLKMADNKMPDLGVPNSSLHGFSMGNGNGSGIGSGDGSGMGPGSGSNFGGGPMHIGGSIHPPSVLYQVEPEFSEEARKAKFSGNVQVYLWVDEHGNPSHIRVARGVGMGLDEKALEAVRQYKFKPAMLNGKPVKVDLYIDVDFHIY